MKDIEKFQEYFKSRSIIKKALSKVNGIKNKAAALLCLNRTTLVEKIKKLDIKA